MSWLSLAIIAATAGALCAFFDNYITDTLFKGKSPQSQKIFYAPLFFLTALIVALIFGLEHVDYWTAVLLTVSGFIGCIATIPYYMALGIEDATSASIFIELAPVLYLAAGAMFLGEEISLLELIGMAVVLAGPILLILSERRKSGKSKVKVAVLFAIYVIVAVVGNILFVKVAPADTSLTTIMFYVIIGKGLSGLVLGLLFKKWRNKCKEVIHKHKRKAIIPMVVAHCIWIGKDFAYRGALAMAPVVAMVSATSDTLQPLITFFLGIVLTIIWPKFGREKLNRRTIIFHFLATALVVIGVILMKN